MECGELINSPALAFRHELLINIERGARAGMPQLGLGILNIRACHFESRRVARAQAPPVREPKAEFSSISVEDMGDYFSGRTEGMIKASADHRTPIRAKPFKLEGE